MRINRRFLKVVVNNDPRANGVTAKHQSDPPAMGTAIVDTDCALSPGRDAVGSGQMPLPSGPERRPLLSIDCTQLQPRARKQRAVHIGGGQLEPSRFRKSQELELRAVGPATTTPVADRAMADPDRFRDRDHTTELLDQIHGAQIDTERVGMQARFVSCNSVALGHDSTMAAKRTELMIAMGRRLAIVRMALNKSQGAIAEILNISRSAVGNYEQGTRKFSNEQLNRLYDTTGVRGDYMLRGDHYGMPQELQAKLRAAETLIDDPAEARKRVRPIRRAG